jgi:tetratricopeptide (TPR) repeat protein
LRARKSARSAAALLAGILANTPLLVAAEPDAPIDSGTSANQFAAAIDSFNALDPQSPNTLNARLAYARFLTRLEGGDCRAHLDEAQKQLDAATADRAFVVVIPSGPALVADIEYQLHLARASCGAGAALRDQELHAALESAQRAVDLYRDAFDAVSMVTMQFNVGVTYHNLGDDAAALAALRTTLDLDREYGFADDAEDNYELLLQWSDEDAGPEQVAERMQDFPQRTATLTFGWFESDAKVGLQSDVSLLAGTESVHIRGSRSAQRQVRRRLGSWRVSYQLDQPHFETGDLPTDDLLALHFASSLARMLAQFHDFSVSRNGDFGHSSSEFKFEWRARADIKALAGDFRSRGLDSKGRHSSQPAHLFVAAAEAALSPEATETQIAEDYNLAAGTWIAATLEQGVWYDMTASLSLPIIGNSFVHKIQFTYSRPVPCTPDSSDASCIEIVLHAAPDPAILRGLQTVQLQLWSATSMRLVTDPKTLQPYSCEIRRHAYWSNGVPGPDHSLFESEKTVVSSGAITRAQ